MSPSDQAPALASDNPASRKESEGVEVSSGNVFADLGLPHPGIHFRLADANVAGLPMPITNALAKLVSVAIDAGDGHEPQLVTALEGAITAIMGTVLPAEMTPAIAEVLGMPNFVARPYAHLFRAAGAEIDRRSEPEQAFVLWWLLHLVLRHGDDWRTVADRDLAAAKDRTRSRIAEQGEKAHG